MKKLLSIIAAGVITTLAIVGVKRADRRHNYNNNLVTIGAILSLTGRAATYGERSLQGMQVAVDDLNAERGEGQKIALVVEDSQSEASRAVTAFIKLVDINKAPAIVGLLTSDEALACAPLAVKRKIVALSPGATATELKNAGAYFFRNRESVELQTEVIARACVGAVPGGKIAVMYANAANAISYRETFEAACIAMGAQVVGSVAFNEGKGDYRSELEQLRALNAAAVYLAGYDNELGLILKQAREVGLTTRFFASAGAVTPKLLEIAGTGAEGLIAASASFDPASTEPHVRKFVEAYKSRFNKEPDWLAANSYDAISMLSLVATTANPDSESIRQGLVSMNEFPGVSGITTFDGSGGVIKSIALVTVRDGRFIPISENLIN